MVAALVIPVPQFEELFYQNNQARVVWTTILTGAISGMATVPYGRPVIACAR